MKKLLSIATILVLLSVPALNVSAAVSNKADLDQSFIQSTTTGGEPEQFAKMSPGDISWPDAAYETSGTTVDEEKKLALGAEFEISVQGPDKVVCSNGCPKDENFKLQITAAGGTQVKQVSKSYNAAMKAVIFKMKVEEVDAQNPDVSAKVIICYNDYTPEGVKKGEISVGSKEMKLGISKETKAVDAFTGEATATGSVDSKRKLSGAGTDIKSEGGVSGLVIIAGVIGGSSSDSSENSSSTSAALSALDTTSASDSTSVSNSNNSSFKSSLSNLFNKIIDIFKQLINMIFNLLKKMFD